MLSFTGRIYDSKEVNSITRLIQRVKDMQCCWENVNAPANPMSFPSQQNYVQMISRIRESLLPWCRTAQQVGYLKAMEDIRRSAPADQQSRMTSITKFAWLAGRVLFGCDPALTIEFRWAHAGEFSGDDRGQTAFKNVCSRHKQFHTATIMLNDRRSDSNDADAYWVGILSTLIHELCHAYLKIFMSFGGRSAGNDLRVCGCQGHGTAFDWLLMVIANILRSAKALDIDLESCLNHSVNQDNYRQTQIREIASDIIRSDKDIERGIISRLINNLGVDAVVANGYWCLRDNDGCKYDHQDENT